MAKDILAVFDIDDQNFIDLDPEAGDFKTQRHLQKASLWLLHRKYKFHNEDSSVPC